MNLRNILILLLTFSIGMAGEIKITDQSGKEHDIPGYLFPFKDSKTILELDLETFKNSTKDEEIYEVLKFYKEYSLLLGKTGNIEEDLIKLYSITSVRPRLFSATEEQRLAMATSYLLKPKIFAVVKRGPYFKIYPFSEEKGYLLLPPVMIGKIGDSYKAIVDDSFNLADASFSQKVFEHLVSLVEQQQK